MAMPADDLLTQVLRLPRRERARVAEALLSSLEEAEEEVAAAWAAELERRSREAAEGLAPLEDWQVVRTRIVKELERRRAGRSSS
jgi:putative addiction module component (TIGR02574 family)